MVEIKIEIPERLTKNDEGRILRQLQSVFASKDTYLRHLFTDKMVEWVEQYMMDDRTPDLMEDRTYWEMRAMDAGRQRDRLAAQRVQTRASLETLRAMVDDLREALAKGDLVKVTYRNADRDRVTMIWND